jgi:hypothetical protein
MNDDLNAPAGTPPISADTPAATLLHRHGDRWLISRETLDVWVAVLKAGTATRVLAGEPAALLAAIERAEAEE